MMMATSHSGSAGQATSLPPYSEWVIWSAFGLTVLFDVDKMLAQTDRGVEQSGSSSGS